MKFQLHDGTVVQGRGYEDIVAEMATLKIRTPKSLATYRKATARRARELYGAEIVPTDNRAFVRSMVAEGLAQQLP